MAHNWDVVCIAKDFERGDIDLKRFYRRHAQYWGIMIYPDWKEMAADALQMEQFPAEDVIENDGQITKGVPHVSPKLAYELMMRPLKMVNFGRHNRYMLRQVERRDHVYAKWKIGEEYSNFSYSVTNLDVRDLKIRTVYTVENTIKRMLAEFRVSIAMGAFSALNVAFYLFLQSLESGITAGCLSTAVVLIVGTMATTAFGARNAFRLAKKFLIEQPPDGILLDAGRALLAALKDAGLVSRNLQMEYVRVVETPDKAYQVLLDYASPEDSGTFVRAFREIFDPVRDQRYLIFRDDSRLPNLLLRPFWLVLRQFVRTNFGYKPAYHPVPKILSQRKERALAFAQYWEKYVGGGKLVFTRSETGRKVLLEARAQQRPKVKGLAFEIWR